ncbi:MAG TPA: GntR family transcriptional regulator [Devosia sp.]|nr:GntR family transcriptional regulator [Devosia sp.]
MTKQKADGVTSRSKSAAVSLGAKAYSSIREKILSRALKSGEAISEERLAEDLSISRTPVREALLLLQSEGLIQKEANQPFRVRHVTNREYFQSMRMRELLEGEAISIAVGKIDLSELAAVEMTLLELQKNPDVPAEIHWLADETLHEMIAQASGNDVMVKMIRELRVTTRLFELSGLPSRVRPDVAEHINILEAIKAGNPELSHQQMRSHIRSLTSDVLNAMTNL